MELDFSQALDAAHKALARDINLSDAIADAILEGVMAAAANIERQVLEREAQKLLDWAEEFNDGRLSGPRAAMRRHILICARRVAPTPTLQEVADAFLRGDYMECHLDDAGQPITRGGGHAA